jgi:hypothetical protein
LAQAGGVEIFMVRDVQFGSCVTDDVLRKKYIMLTKFYFVRGVVQARVGQKLVKRNI